MTGTRVWTAFVMVPLVVALVWWGPTWLVAAVLALVTILALDEFFGIAAVMGVEGYRRATMIWALVLVFAQGSRGKLFGLQMPVDLLLYLFVLTLAGMALAGRRPVGETLEASAVSGGAFLFVALPLSFLARLHNDSEHGIDLLFVLVLVWVGDTAAYFGGQKWGKHALAPTISPKKTWEGAAANLAGAVLVALAMGLWRGSLPHWLAIAVLVSLVGQLGDLFESAWKRSAGLKDSGTLLPGHGGILDRIDALIFAGPVVWYYGLLI